MKFRIILASLLCCIAFSAHAAFRACGAVASGTSVNGTVSAPTGVQTNDVVVLIFQYSTSVTATLPAGFTNITSSPKQFNSINHNNSSYYMIVATRIATSSEPTSYTVTWTGSFAWMGVTCAFSGRNTASPITASALTNVGGTTSPVTFNMVGVTAASGDDVLWIPAFSNTGSAPTWTSPTGYTSQTQGDDATSPYPHFNLSTKTNVSAGATGTLTGTETGLAGDENGFVLSLAAASGAICTHAGITSGGAISVPNGTSGSYHLRSGIFGTPDCSTVSYKQPTVGDFGVN